MGTFGGHTLEAGRDRRFGVGSTDQSPTTIEDHARTIKGDDLVHRGIMGERLFQGIDDGELGVIGAVEALFRRGVIPGQISDKVGQRDRFAGEGGQEVRPGKGAVVEVDDRITKEGVAREFAGEDGVGLAAARHDVGVAGARHDRHATGGGDAIDQALGTLDIEDHTATGVRAQGVPCQDDKVLVGPEDFAGVIHHTQPVAIAIQGNAHVGLGLLHLGDQVAQVLGLEGIGHVVGEGAIRLAIEGNDLAPEGGEGLDRDRTGHAVPGIDDHFQGAGQLDLCGDVAHIVVHDIMVVVGTSGGLAEGACLRKTEQVLDI